MSLELDEDFDADHRQLCPDGNCTGVLDDTGTCKLCGARGEAAAVTEATGAAEVVAAVAAVAEEPSSDPFDDRQLCPDGNCVGLIGPDGRCKLCGTPATND